MRRRAAGFGTTEPDLVRVSLSFSRADAAALLSLALTTHVYAQRPIIDDLVAPADPKAEFETELCKLIEAAAMRHDIPSDFFTRLLWKESRFQSDALSPKGAQGIAQFMPDTAAERGLLDPFDMATAIPASASYLADLKAQFGNLGLAAAAYNAGPQRVSDWLADESAFPYRDAGFVLSITGTGAETWAEPEFVEASAATNAKEENCTSVIALLKIPGQDLGPAIATEFRPLGRPGCRKLFPRSRPSLLRTATKTLYGSDRRSSAHGDRHPHARPRHARLLPRARSRTDARGSQRPLRRNQSHRR